MKNVKDSGPNHLLRILDNGDCHALKAAIAADSAMVHEVYDWSKSCPIGSCTPLSWLAQARFYGLANHENRAAMAKILLDAGAPVDGLPEDRESPLITAASYNDLGVAEALVNHGANLELTGYAVPGETALAHSVHFGAAEIATLLADRGAAIGAFWIAAGVGNLEFISAEPAPADQRVRALRAAAVCGRLNVIDSLLQLGTGIHEASDGGTALHWAAWEARKESAERLVAHGADTSLRDADHNATPLEWAQYRYRQAPHAHPQGHEAVIAYLTASTG